MAKEEVKQQSTTVTDPKQPDSPLSIVSMVLGVVSMTGPGLLLGIPAIITAGIALKKKQGGRTLSIIGLVTGIISTVISILFILFICVLVMWGITHPDMNNNPRYHHYDDPYPDQSEQIFNN